MQILLSFLLLFSFNAIAGEYYLNQGESLSELLYNRLEISPIYRNGYLKEVLIYNNLDEESAKKLPPGTPIKLPGLDKKVTKKEQSSEKENPTAEIVSPSSTSFTEWRQRFGLGVAFDIFNGKEKSSPVEYSSNALRPVLEYKISRYFGEDEFSILLNASYMMFQKDESRIGDDSFFSSQVEISYLKIFLNSISAGPSIRYGNSIYFEKDSSGSNYRIINPWLYSIGGQLIFQKIWGIGFYFIPDQNLSSISKSRSNFEGIVSYNTKLMDKPVSFSLSYANNEINTFFENRITAQAIYYFSL